MSFLRKDQGLAGVASLVLGCMTPYAHAVAVPDKTVILTFDDAVKSQYTFVAPLLKELGFSATFFVTQAWMSDATNFMSWRDVAELHSMGFEIGSHSWTHGEFGSAEGGMKLGRELEMVESKLAEVEVPIPISFSFPGSEFGPEAIAQLRTRGYKLARRGSGPEYPENADKPGLAFDPTNTYPLLIPSTGTPAPYWTLTAFKSVAQSARNGRVAVIQFHGVPDVAHPWCSTAPELFRTFMIYLKTNRYHVIAMRDVLPYYDMTHLPNDPMLRKRYTEKDLSTPGAVDPRMLALIPKPAQASPSVNGK